LKAIHLTTYGNPAQSFKMAEVSEPVAPSAGEAPVRMEYPTQRAQVQGQVGESIATVQLYKTLGGGIVVQYLSKQ